MPKIKVYPTHENSLSIVHPTDGPMKHDGADWEYDGFTARMLDDNAVTSNEAAAHVCERERPDHTKPPAHATAVATRDDEATDAATSSTVN